jgi:D-lactate dehydrogenase
MFDVYFYEAFSEEASALKRLLPPSIRAGYTDRTIQESADSLPPASLISVRTQSVLPVAWASRLSGILSRSTGYDHLLEYARTATRQIALGYLPLYCHRAVAEHAMMLWMALLRRLPRQLRQFPRFHRDGITGAECAGKTLVVVGVGHIGHEVCVLGKALGMQVIGVDRQPSHLDISYLSIEQVLPLADVLVCAMDLNASNRGFFNRERLTALKAGAIFVNISRGELSPSSALLSAITSGHLGGVALDVFDHEGALAVALRSGLTTDSIDDPEAKAAVILSQRDDVICTPHNAFNSQEAVERKSQHSVQQIEAFLGRGAFLWNAPRPIP